MMDRGIARAVSQRKMHSLLQHKKSREEYERLERNPSVESTSTSIHTHGVLNRAKSARIRMLLSRDSAIEEESEDEGIDVDTPPVVSNYGHETNTKLVHDSSGLSLVTENIRRASSNSSESAAHLTSHSHFHDQMRLERVQHRLRQTATILQGEDVTPSQRKPSPHVLSPTPASFASQVINQTMSASEFWDGLRTSMQVQALLGGNSHSIQTKDASSGYFYNRRFDKMQAILKTLTLRRLLSPQGAGKQKWDVFILFIVVFSILWLPFSFSFDTDYDLYFQYMEVFICGLFLIDILVTFNTAVFYIKKNEYLITRVAISKNYLLDWFVVDLLSSIPIDIIFKFSDSAFDGAALSLIRLLRFIRISKVVKFLKKYELNRYQTAALGVLSILWLCHTFGCFWWYLGNSGVNDNADGTAQNWIDSAELNHVKALNSTTFDDYVLSIYYATVTLLTIGYGDIHPVNNGERLYAMGMMVVGAISFGYLISQVAKILDNSDPHSDSVTARTSDLYAYLRESGKVPYRLRLQAKRAFAYSTRTQKSSSLLKNHLIRDLPPALLTPILLRAFSVTLERCFILKDLVEAGHDGFVALCLFRSRPFEAYQHEVLFHQNDLCTEIIFVTRGEIQLASRVNRNAPILEGFVTEGSYYGDVELYINHAYLFTLTASSHCEYLSLSKHAFEDICLKYPKSYQHFLHLTQTRTENLIRIVKSKSILLPEDGYYYNPPTQSPPMTRSRLKLWIDGVAVGYQSEAAQGIANKKKVTSSQPHASFRCYVVYPEDASFAYEFLTSREIWTSHFILHPALFSKMVWDCAMDICAVYSMYVVTVQVAFYRVSAGPWFIITMTIDALFFLDIALSFRTSFLDADIAAYILDTSDIRHNYLHSWFVIDLCSAIPWEAIVHAGASVSNADALNILNVLRLFKLLRMLKVSALYRLIRRLFQEKHAIVLDLASLATKILTLCHFVACLWWAVSTQVQNTSWIDDSNQVDSLTLRSASLLDQYIISVYWSLTTLTTLGYGDIYSLNTGNRIVAIFVILIGASLFGYILGSVGVIFEVSATSAAMLQSRREELLCVLSAERVSGALIQDSLAHFEMTYSHTSVYEEESLLDDLPTSLRHQLYLCVREDVLANIPLFDSIINHSERYFLLRLMQVKYYAENEVIIERGTIPKAIHFLVMGSCCAFQPSHDPKSPHADEELVLYLQPRNFLGHKSVSTGSTYPYTVRATEPCCIYQLSKTAISSLVASPIEFSLKVQHTLLKAIEAQKWEFKSNKRRQDRFAFLKECLDASKILDKSQLLTSLSEEYPPENSIRVSRRLNFNYLRKSNEQNSTSRPCLLEDDDICDFHSDDGTTTIPFDMTRALQRSVSSPHLTVQYERKVSLEYRPRAHTLE